MTVDAIPYFLSKLGERPAKSFVSSSQKKMRSTRGFSVLLLFLLLLPAYSSAQPSPRVVATFQCLGLYWSPTSGSENIKCHVNYRKADSDDWQAAQDLWFDDRKLDGRGAEYRGSIVNLDPGTHYKVQLWLEDKARTEMIIDAATWSETLPISKTIVLPARSAQTLTIDQP